MELAFPLSYLPIADRTAMILKAQRRYRWDLERTFDDADAMAGWWGGTELFYKPRTHAERVRLFDAVTPEKIRRVARRVLRPERMTVAAVGPLTDAIERKVRAAIRAFP